MATNWAAPSGRRAMLVIRRTHLYLGLFLFPWAILYGVTAVLFNHPTAFADAPTVDFGLAATAGTALEGLPPPDEQAAAVVAALNARAGSGTPYALGEGAAKYVGRDYLFATARSGDRTFSLLYEVAAPCGTVRETTAPPVVTPEPAPFAVGKARPKGGTPLEPSESLKVAGSLAERFREAGPTVLERCGFPRADVTVTSTPDLGFPLVADGRAWSATYNPLTGALSGVPAGSEAVAPAGSARRFLLRLHTTHGYPGVVNARWGWAVAADAMGVVLGFWGLSGLLMWWQVKATRRAGLAVLAAGLATAAALGVAMAGATG